MYWKDQTSKHNVPLMSSFMCAVSHLAPLYNACPRVYLKIILTKHEKQFQIASMLRQNNVSYERGQKADIFTTNAPVKIHQMALF